MKTFLLLPVVFTAIGVSGCETMEGFGKDVQRLGDSIEKSASDDDENE